MAIKEINEKTTKRGGIREGAGRKKSLPEGAKPSSFILTDAEKTAVKKYIVSMRNEAKGKPIVSIDWEKTTFEMVIKMLRPFALTMIRANGGAPYEKVEKLMKDAAIIAFKDAVSDYGVLFQYMGKAVMNLKQAPIYNPKMTH